MPESTVEAPQRSRKELREACKLQYISGRKTLAELSVSEEVPYDTLMFWSKEENWKNAKQTVAEVSHRNATDAMAEFLQREREGQIKRSLKRMARVQEKSDTILPNVDNAKDLLAVANAEQVADLVIRRNLGMDASGGTNGNGGVTVNVLGSVQIKGQT